jgi:hypothetical protein
MIIQHNPIIGIGWRFPLGIDGRGHVALSSGQQDIEEAIEIILNTPVGTRVMRPTFGCRIHDLNFAPLNASTTTAACHYVEQALSMWEPRIEVLDIQAEAAEIIDEPGAPLKIAPAARNSLHRSSPHALPCLLLWIRYLVRATHDERALIYPFYTIPEEF